MADTQTKVAEAPTAAAAGLEQTLTDAELKFFAKQGYLVKRNVLDRGLCAHAVDRMWSFAGPTRLKRDEPSTWPGPFEADTEGPPTRAANSDSSEIETLP
jgi:hypothetical protein